MDLSAACLPWLQGTLDSPGYLWKFYFYFFWIVCSQQPCAHGSTPILGQEQSSSCSYFKKRNIIAETKNWHAIYCSFISDSCFQLLHADRKFWSHRYLFLHLCTHISGNTGYSEREIFLPDRKNKNSFKELVAMKGPVESDAKKCAGDNSGSYWINRISLFPVPLNP